MPPAPFNWPVHVNSCCSEIVQTEKQCNGFFSITALDRKNLMLENVSFFCYHSFNLPMVCHSDPKQLGDQVLRENDANERKETINMSTQTTIVQKQEIYRDT